MGFNQAPALPYRNLGIAQDGDTASRAIPKGKYVIWKGGNYFAKTDILQGETFVVDTNLTEIPDGEINGIVTALSASLRNVELLATSTTQGEVIITLSKPYTNYAFLLIELSNSESPSRNNEFIIPTAIIDSNKYYNFNVSWSNRFMLCVYFQIASTTQIIIKGYDPIGGWALGSFKVYGVL